MSRGRKLLAAAAVAALAATGAVLWRAHGRSPERVRRIILISIDTLRADHLGCYGFARPVSPHLDAVAAEGVRFQEVTAAAPITLVSHTTMLTGTLPPQHGVHDNVGYALGPHATTLAEALKSRGYRTGAVVGSFILDHSFGLAQGFDSYDDLSSGVQPPGSPRMERRAAEVTARGIDWLERNASEDFFLFLHYFDPHLSYDPPEPFATSFADDPYAGEIASVDAAIGQVIDWLKKLGLYDSTLLVITADHGEGLGEHGETGHSYFIYQSTLRVPLLVKLPGHHPARTVSQRVTLADLMPTVLSLAGVEAPAAVTGRDLTPLLGWWPSGRARSLYAESLTPTKFGLSPLLGLVEGDWKYIQSSKPELYDLARDPAEANNRVSSEPARAERMRGALEALLGAAPAASGQEPVDEERRQSLEALGYLGGSGVDEGSHFDQSREDAKDFLPFYNRFMEARARLAGRDLAQARSLSEALTHDRPDVPDFWSLLAQVDLAEGKTDEALAHLGEHLARAAKRMAGKGASPLGLAAVHDDMATLLVKAGRALEAIDHLREEVRIEPRAADAHKRLASLLTRLRRVDEALPEWREAVKLKPDDVEALRGLGEAQLLSGDIDGSAETWEQAIARKPGDPVLLLNSAASLLRKGKLNEAANRYREAQRLRPDWIKPYYGLGQTFYLLGKTDDAIRAWTAGLSAAPRESLSVLKRLSWVLATATDARFRNGALAVQLAEQARDATGGQDPAVLDVLGAAYAEAGKAAPAAEAARKAAALYRAAGDGEGEKAAEERAKLFRSGKPYREAPKAD